MDHTTFAFAQVAKGDYHSLFTQMKLQPLSLSFFLECVYLSPGFMWMDGLDPDEVLPIYNGNIIAKVLQLGMPSLTRPLPCVT